MEDSEELKPIEVKIGSQIAYFPGHVSYGNFNHPDVERGFVVSLALGTPSVHSIVFCRFWRKGSAELRTVTNSEACHLGDLRLIDTHPQSYVNGVARRLGYEVDALSDL